MQRCFHSVSFSLPASTADLKHNVTEAMISMARQTGKIGPDVSGGMV